MIMQTPPKWINAQQVIDPEQWTQQERHLKGALNTLEMTRLQTTLYRPDAQIATATAHIAIDWRFHVVEHHNVVEGQINFDLPFQCQRCMDVLHWQKQRIIRLCLLQPDEKDNNLPSGYEATLLEESQITLLDLVEEETLLNLPLAPVHDVCSTNHYLGQPINIERDQPNNPFNILSQLKNKE
jgi:uncharacterized protein